MTLVHWSFLAILSTVTFLPLRTPVPDNHHYEGEAHAKHILFPSCIALLKVVPCSLCSDNAAGTLSSSPAVDLYPVSYDSMIRYVNGKGLSRTSQA
jgi:hypothetical protein